MKPGFESGPLSAALRYPLSVQFLLVLAAFQGSDQPKFRDCVPGLKVLNCGSGVRSSFLPCLANQVSPPPSPLDWHARS